MLMGYLRKLIIFTLAICDFFVTVYEKCLFIGVFRQREVKKVWDNNNSGFVFSNIISSS